VGVPATRDAGAAAHAASLRWVCDDMAEIQRRTGLERVLLRLLEASAMRVGAALRATA
jgi:hypothetical protein